MHSFASSMMFSDGQRPIITSYTQADNATSAVLSSSNVFSSSFLSTYGITGQPSMLDTTSSVYGNPAPGPSAALSTGAIVGIAVGGFVGLGLIAGVSVFLIKKGGKGSPKVAPTPERLQVVPAVESA